MEIWRLQKSYKAEIWSPIPLSIVEHCFGRLYAKLWFLHRNVGFICWSKILNLWLHPQLRCHVTPQQRCLQRAKDQTQQSSYAGTLTWTRSHRQTQEESSFHWFLFLSKKSWSWHSIDVEPWIRSNNVELSNIPYTQNNISSLLGQNLPVATHTHK